MVRSAPQLNALRNTSCGPRATPTGVAVRWPADAITPDFSGCQARAVRALRQTSFWSQREFRHVEDLPAGAYLEIANVVSGTQSANREHARCNTNNKHLKSHSSRLPPLKSALPQLRMAKLAHAVWLAPCGVRARLPARRSVHNFAVRQRASVLFWYGYISAVDTTPP